MPTYKLNLSPNYRSKYSSLVTLHLDSALVKLMIETFYCFIEVWFSVNVAKICKKNPWTTLAWTGAGLFCLSRAWQWSGTAPLNPWYCLSLIFTQVNIMKHNNTLMILEMVIWFLLFQYGSYKISNVKCWMMLTSNVYNQCYNWKSIHL